MAIEALHGVAEVLRHLGGGSAFAEPAEEQARLLRGFAREHAGRDAGA